MITRQNQLLLLEEIIQRAHITEPWVINAIISLQAHWNDLLFNRVASYIQTNLPMDVELLCLFNYPADQSELPGELSLGHVIGPASIEFRHLIKRLPMHIFAPGSSGSGKSTFAQRLAEEAHLSSVESIHITDPKSDEYIRLARKHPEFQVLTCNDLRFKPFCQPPNVPQDGWFQTITGHMAQCFNFWQGAESLLLHELHKAPPGKLSIPWLISSISSKKSSYKYKDAMIVSTLSSRLQMLFDMFGKTITADSCMLEKLMEKKIIILTSGLMAEAESWLTEFLLLWKFMYRVHNPSMRNLSLNIYDECQHRLFSNEKEKKIHKFGSSIVSQLVDQSRAMNIGICSLSQEPSTLINAVINNSFLKLAFHLGSGIEIKIVKEAMGLTNEQADLLHHLEPGQAIARIAGGFMHAFPVALYDFQETNTCSESEFRKHQSHIKEQLYEETVKRQITAVKPAFQESSQKSPAISGKSYGPSAGHSQEHYSQKRQNWIDTIMPLLQVWLNLPHPFLTQGEIFKKVGISSGSKQAKIKKELIRRLLIIEQKIQKAKTYFSIWEPADKAYEIINKSRPTHRSKGGYLHAFLTHRIKKWGESHGYEVKIEFMLSNNKAVDLVLKNEQQLVFVEVAISRPFEKEIRNIIKDFATELIPDRLAIAAKDSKTRKKIQNLVDNNDSLDAYRNKIDIILAGDLITI
jgi:hypothetical protein